MQKLHISACVGVGDILPAIYTFMQLQTTASKSISG